MDVEMLYSEFRRGNLNYDGEGRFSWSSQGAGQPEIPLGAGLDSKLIEYISTKGSKEEIRKIFGEQEANRIDVKDEVQFPTI